MITKEGLAEELDVISKFLQLNDFKPTISWYDFCNQYRKKDSANLGKQSIENISLLIESLSKPDAWRILISKESLGKLTGILADAAKRFTELVERIEKANKEGEWK